MAPQLVFVGGGKMGEALLGGLISSAWAPASAFGVVEPSAERRAALSARFPDVVMLDIADVAETDIVIAVKPHHVADVTNAVAGRGIGRALSIAAGVTIDALESGLAGETAVIRCMPNTPALVGKGASAIAGGAHAGPDDLAWATAILSSVGTVTVLDEAALDAVTGLSGSGPAYVFMVAEAMIAAGQQVGLSPDVADALARQTLLGAATLLAESGEDPAVLRQNVTSPGGTTAEGLAVLEAHGLRQAFAEAIAAATARSIELGN